MADLLSLIAGLQKMMNYVNANVDNLKATVDDLADIVWNLNDEMSNLNSRVDVMGYQDVDE